MWGSDTGTAEGIYGATEFTRQCLAEALAENDTGTAEGIYGATEFTRQCLAEALAEKVVRKELLEKDARHIGRQIMRENALELFPQLKDRLWRK